MELVYWIRIGIAGDVFLFLGMVAVHEAGNGVTIALRMSWSG